MGDAWVRILTYSKASEGNSGKFVLSTCRGPRHFPVADLGDVHEVVGHLLRPILRHLEVDDLPDCWYTFDPSIASKGHRGTPDDLRGDPHSAGLGYFLAAFSLATGVRVNKDLAFTAELETTGSVAQVGELSAKLDAATGDSAIGSIVLTGRKWQDPRNNAALQLFRKPIIRVDDVTDLFAPSRVTRILRRRDLHRFLRGRAKLLRPSVVKPIPVQRARAVLESLGCYVRRRAKLRLAATLCVGLVLAAGLGVHHLAARWTTRREFWQAVSHGPVLPAFDRLRESGVVRDPHFVRGLQNLRRCAYGLAYRDLSQAECPSGLEKELLYCRAFALMAGEDDMKALKYVKRGCRLHPGDGHFGALLSRVLYYQKRFPDALREARLAAGASGEELDPSAHVYAAMALVRMGRDSEATVHLDKAIEMKVRSGYAYAKVAAAYRDAGYEDKAREITGKAIYIDPTYVAAHVDQGWDLVERKEYEKAVRALKIAIGLDPENARARNNLGWAYLKLGNQTNAVVEFMRATELNPEHRHAFSNLGGLFTRKGEFAKAQSWFRRLLAVRPNDAGVHNDIGWAYCEQGRFEDAEKPLRRSLELKENDANTHANLAWSLRFQGKRQEAAKHYKRAIELEPDDDRWIRRLSKHVETQAECEDAFDFLRATYPPEKRRTQVLLTLGYLCDNKMKKNWKKAREYYKEVLTKDPNHAMAHNNLGWNLYNQKRYDEAKRLFEQAISLDAKCLQAHNNLALLHERLGNVEMAERFYRKAITIAPKDKRAYAELFRVYAFRNHMSEAKEVLAEALKQMPDDERLKMAIKWLELTALSNKSLEAFRTELKKGDHPPFANLILALELLKRGKVSEAIHHFREMGKESPDLRRVGLTGLALISLIEGEDKVAAEYLAKVSMIKGVEEDEWSRGAVGALRGLCDLNSARPTEGLRKLETALTDSPALAAGIAGPVVLRCGYPGLAKRMLIKLKAFGVRSDDVDNLLRTIRTKHPDLGDRQPGVALSYVRLAQRLVRIEGRKTEAVAAATMATKYDPQSSPAHDILGMTYALSGQLLRAKNAHMKAIALDPKNAVCHSNLAICYVNMGAYDDAIRSFEQAIALDPLDADYREDLARTLLFTGKKIEGRRQLAKAIELAGDTPVAASAMVVLGAHHAAGGDLPTGERLCRQALAKHPECWTAHVHLWLIHKEKGETQQADRALKKARTFLLERPGRVVELASRMGTKNCVAMAEALLLPVVDRMGNQAACSGLIAIGNAYLSAGDTTKAKILYEKARVLLPKDPESAYHLGRLYRKTGDAQAEIAALEKAVTLDSEFLMARLSLAGAYIRAGRDADFERVLKATVEMFPDHPAAYAVLSDFYLAKRGAYEKGVENYVLYRLKGGEEKIIIVRLEERLQRGKAWHALHRRIQTIVKASRATNSFPVAWLEDKNPLMRSAGILVVCELDATRAVKHLISMLKDKDTRVRHLAVKALGTAGDPRAVKPIVKVLSGGQDEDLRCAAAVALGTLKDRRAVRPLLAALRDKSPIVVALAADALGGIGDRRAVVPLLKLLGHPDPIMRREVAGALGNIGDKKALPALTALLKKDDTPYVSIAAAGALVKMGQRQHLATVQRELTEGKQGLDRSTAAKLLGEVRSREAIEPLIGGLRDGEARVRRACLKALEQMLDRKFDFDPEAPEVVRRGKAKKIAEWYAGVKAGKKGEKKEKGEKGKKPVKEGKPISSSFLGHPELQLADRRVVAA